MKNTFTFKVESIRTMASPNKINGISSEDSETLYYLMVNMNDLPNDLPLDVNPREQKMTTNVAKKIIGAVIDPETDFHINNRGIVISAKELSFNTVSSEVTISLGEKDDEDDLANYGILDGGHTYRAIINNRSKISPDLQKFVRVEVITNVQNISRLSDARNTSVEVSDLALFNLDDKFDLIKKSISNEKYSNDIAYKDNEPKSIHVSDLLRLMFAFDIEKFKDDSTAPIQSYSGKAQVFKRYRSAYESDFYKALTKEIPRLVNLYDKIEVELADKYSDFKNNEGVKNPKFGLVRGVERLNKPGKSYFLSNSIDYSISSGYLYPIFGAFRALIKYDSEEKKIKWIFDPLEMWEEIGYLLAQNIFNTSNNPQLAGKDKQLWLSTYRIVETQSLRKLLDEKMKKID